MTWCRRWEAGSDEIWWGEREAQMSWDVTMRWGYEIRWDQTRWDSGDLFRWDPPLLRPFKNSKGYGRLWVPLAPNRSLPPANINQSARSQKMAAFPAASHWLILVPVGPASIDIPSILSTVQQLQPTMNHGSIFVPNRTHVVGASIGDIHSGQWYSNFLVIDYAPIIHPLLRMVLFGRGTSYHSW